MRDWILGIDLGTTACKALVVDAQACVLARGSATYTTYAPQPDWSEQEPEEVWRGLRQAVHQALHMPGIDAQRIAALSISAAMHSLLPLDKDGRPLSRCWTWADRRAQPQAQRLRQACDVHKQYLRTGCPLQPLYWPARLLWLREQQPDAARATHCYVSLKDYFLQRMVGRRVMDLSLASACGLLNTRTLNWDVDWLHALPLDAQYLPELVPPDTTLGTLHPQWASELGLPSDVQVIAGGADGGLANLGVGAVAPGQVATSIGTSGAVRAVTRRPCFDAEERAWCYVLEPGRWFVGGAISNGGVVYQWLAEQMLSAEVQRASQAGQNFLELFDDWAASIAPGAGGLLCLPFLLGERSPGWHSNARGVLFGLSSRHTHKHIVRAAVEGVAFRLYSVLQILQELLDSTQEIRVTGGLAGSALWMSVLADVYGLPVHVPHERESSALGAAFLALKALGHLRDLDETRSLVPIARVQEPNAFHHQRYVKLYAVFQGIYQDAIRHWDELTLLSGK